MRRIQPLLLALGAYIAFSGLFCCRPAHACGITGFSVGDNLNALPTPTFDSDGSYKRFGVTQVKAHYADQLTQPMRFADSRGTSFSCIDARGDTAILGAPGGDFGGEGVTVLREHIRNSLGNSSGNSFMEPLGVTLQSLLLASWLGSSWRAGV